MSLCFIELKTIQVYKSSIYIHIYIYIYSQTLEKIQLDSIIEVQFCIICHKLFIFRENFIS